MSETPLDPSSAQLVKAPSKPLKERETKKTDPPMPSHLVMQPGVTLEFPVHDTEFHSSNISELEKYTIEEVLHIPIVDSDNKGNKYKGNALNVGDNPRVLRNWFRSGNKGILLWDCKKPIGSELGLYIRKNV